MPEQANVAGPVARRICREGWKQSFPAGAADVLGLAGHQSETPIGAGGGGNAAALNGRSCLPSSIRVRAIRQLAYVTARML